MPIAATDLGGGSFKPITYLVVVIDKASQIETLQLTGMPHPASDALPFSSIRLGMPQARVVEVLGLPGAVQDVPRIRGKLWAYDPFPFSIEMVDSKVYSVRLRRTAAADARAFKPLQRLPD